MWRRNLDAVQVLMQWNLLLEGVGVQVWILTAHSVAPNADIVWLLRGILYQPGTWFKVQVWSGEQLYKWASLALWIVLLVCVFLSVKSVDRSHWNLNFYGLAAAAFPAALARICAGTHSSQNCIQGALPLLYHLCNLHMR